MRETLCTLGNGYFATRGAFSEVEADDIHYPGCYLAGGYNRLVTEISGKAIENEDLVNLPNWLSLKFRIEEGEWVSLRAVEILDFSQELDLRHGLLRRFLRFRDAHGRVSAIHARRLVHMEHHHLAAISWELLPENWSGVLQLRSALDGRVTNSGVTRYRNLANRHLIPVEQGTGGEHIIYLKMATSQSDLRIAQAARLRLSTDGETLAVTPEVISEPGYVAHQLQLEVKQGKKIAIEKVMALHTSRDFASTECGLEAREEVRTAHDFNALYVSQRLYWQALWEQCDIELHTDAYLSHRHPLLILRLHIFHLLQTASPNTIDLDVGVPARGWHGEAYRGHIFWDELFIFPFLNLRMPKITSALLKYRVRRLPEARRAAVQAGFSGAMYPWQSGSNGREESQRLHLNPRSGRWINDYSFLQRHVNGAIVVNLWSYFQVTRDVDFLITHGAEVILEIARFFAQLTSYNPQLERYEILKVMGPDEYHDAYPWSPETPGINNNAYTNLLAVWVLCRALELLQLIPKVHAHDLRRRLQIHPEEEQHWNEISRRMRLAFHDGDILSQFEGYEKLREFPWEDYRSKYGNLQRLDRILEAEGDSTNQYQVSKQADVLMVFYLFSSENLNELLARLNYKFDPEMIQRNIQYYLKRSADGSTLSRVVHSWVLARADRPVSWQLLLDALQSDIFDIQGGTTAEGIHLGAMAGTVDLIQRGYTGIDMGGDILRFSPSLPDPVKLVRFNLRYRGHTVHVDLTPHRLTIALREGTAAPIRVGYGESVYELAAGQRQEIALA